ncbi:hypothetical protein B9Z55_027241 [Caenorhabditis nigoni]|uniref:Uncharacterized protein n=1 Tax=Caenorhabditis nigoni TaxID=1611254 RepID=A0A2G5SH71_9PELO|nr:hypothetical protein B9Z55_027241 [Caenorhabditis nigoni]
MASVDIPDSATTFIVLPGYENQFKKMKVSREVAENEPIQFVLYKCVKNSEVLLLGVHRNEARYLKFEFSYGRKAFKEHCCSCQTPTMESDLIPIYAERCVELQTFVIHCKNSLNGKIEQYIVNADTENLVQVYRPELQFQEYRKSDNDGNIAVCKVKDGLIIIKRSEDSLRKERFEETGNTVHLPDSPVKKLDATEEDDDDETIEIDVESTGHFQDYLASLPVFKAWYCSVKKLMNVRVKIPNTTTYLDYHLENGSMVRSPECQGCSKEVTTESLIPKYSVKLDGFKTILFCRNKLFETIEQYVMDSQNLVLKQVFLPELHYDPTLVNHGDTDVLFIENGIQVSKEGILLIVKKLNRDNKDYEEVTNVPVRVMNQDSEASDAREKDVTDADRTDMEKLEELRGYPYQLFKCVYDEKHKEEIAKRRRSNQEKNANKKVAIVAGETDKEPKPG